MTIKTKFDGPLNTLISCRVRLTDKQRDEFKDAYNALRYSKKPVSAPAVNAGSTITVETSIDYLQEWYHQIGMSAVVIGDIIGARDSVSLPLLLKLQAALGIKSITKKQITDAAKGYVDYVWEQSVV